MAWGLLGSTSMAPLLVATRSFAWSPAPYGLGIGAPFIELASTALGHVPLMFLVMLQLYSVGAGNAEASTSGTGASKNTTDGATRVEEPCSKSLGFNESSGAKDRSYQDLMACDEHQKRTCCEKNSTAKVLTQAAFFAQERSQRCAKMGQLALCSVCDGDVGVGIKSEGNVVSLCRSFCDRWFKACIEDFFASSGSGDGLQPCGHATLVCSPLGEITQDATEFCARIGAPLGATFKVSDPEEEPDSCFDGVPASKSRGPAAKQPWIRPTRRAGNEWWMRFLPDLDPLTIHRINKKLEDNAPGIIIACVALFFGGYVWMGMD